MARGVAESGNPWRRTRLGAARASRCCCCPQQRHTRWPAEVLSWLGGDGRQRPTSRRCRYGRQGLRWWGARVTCTSLLVFMHSLPPFPPRFSIVAAKATNHTLMHRRSLMHQQNIRRSMHQQLQGQSIDASVVTTWPNNRCINEYRAK